MNCWEQSFNLVGGTGLEELYVQLTRQKEGARIAMVEDQLDRAADEAGIDLAPTEKMLKDAKDLARREGVDLPEACRTGFESCRDFLTKGANHVIEDEKIDMGLEKVDALIGSLSRSREKANVLDFTIEEKKEVENKREEREIGTGREKADKREERKESRERVLERGVEM